MVCFFLADFENQGAHRLAKSQDPEGKRTIGKYFCLEIERRLPLITVPDRCSHQARPYPDGRGEPLALLYQE